MASISAKTTEPVKMLAFERLFTQKKSQLEIRGELDMSRATFYRYRKHFLRRQEQASAR
jgi:predicted transcriptional regulator YheO